MNALLTKIGISQSLTQDITLALIVMLVSFVFGMFIGRYKLITILINIYVAFAITSVVPVRYFPEYTLKLAFFLASVMILTVVSKRLFEVYFSGSGSGFLWRVFVMSFLEVMFLISVVFSIIPEKVALGYVSASAYGYFTSDIMRLFWMAVPLVFLVMIHKRLNR